LRLLRLFELLSFFFWFEAFGSASAPQTELAWGCLSHVALLRPYENESIMSLADSDCIRVGVRLRPPVRRSVPKCWAKAADVLLRGENTLKSFSFDFACGTGTSQEQLFQSCGLPELLEAALDGFSVSVLAYGPTGAGKTYTMSGMEAASGAAAASLDPQEEGLLPRGVRYLMERLGEQNRCVFRCSYLEVFNDQVFDLLTVTKKALPVRESQGKGFFVPELLEIECYSLQDVLAVAREGAHNRRKAAHELNKDSSRSHSIFSVTIEHERNGTKVGGKACFVDLAGSERIKESKSADVETVCGINRSLFALGKVISALGDRALIEAAIAAGEGSREDFVNASWIPYRDSTLTMLLKDALGGSAKALMIACVDPSNPNVHEVESTLGYALRVRDITNAPVRRTVSAADELDGAREMNQQLQRDLDRCVAEREALRHRVAELERQVAQLQSDVHEDSRHNRNQEEGRDGDDRDSQDVGNNTEAEHEGPEHDDHDDDEDEDDDTWTEDSEMLQLQEELRAKSEKIIELDRVVQELSDARSRQDEALEKLDAKLHLREKLSHDLQADVLHLRDKIQILSQDLDEARKTSSEMEAAYTAVEMRNHELEEALQNLHRVFVNGGPKGNASGDVKEKLKSRSNSRARSASSTGRPDTRELEAENAYLKELVLTLQSEKPASAGSASALAKSRRAENASESAVT